MQKPFTDDFSDPASGWIVEESPAFAAAYSDGHYVLTAKRPGTTVAPAAPLISPATAVSVFTRATLRGGGKDTVYGVFCLSDGSRRNAYVLGITPDRKYLIARVNDGRAEILHVPDASVGVVRPVGRQNDLRADCIQEGTSTELRLTVNDVLVLSITDGDGLAHGSGSSSGLYLQSVNRAHVQFDDFSIRALTPEELA